MRTFFLWTSVLLPIVGLAAAQPGQSGQVQPELAPANPDTPGVQTFSDGSTTYNLDADHMPLDELQHLASNISEEYGPGVLEFVLDDAVANTTVRDAAIAADDKAESSDLSTRALPSHPGAAIPILQAALAKYKKQKNRQKIAQIMKAVNKIKHAAALRAQQAKIAAAKKKKDLKLAQQVAIGAAYQIACKAMTESCCKRNAIVRAQGEIECYITRYDYQFRPWKTRMCKPIKWFRHNNGRCAEGFVQPICPNQKKFL